MSALSLLQPRFGFTLLYHRQVALQLPFGDRNLGEDYDWCVALIDALLSFIFLKILSEFLNRFERLFFLPTSIIFLNSAHAFQQPHHFLWSFQEKFGQLSLALMLLGNVDAFYLEARCIWWFPRPDEFGVCLHVQQLGCIYICIIQ